MRLLLLLVSSINFTVAYAEDEANTRKQSSFAVEREVPIDSVLGRFHMVVDLGELPAGANGTVKLKLLNKHRQSFSIESLELGCRCSSATLDFDAIRPNSVAELSVDLSTARHARKATVSNTLTLISSDSKADNINIVLRYRLAGLLSFTGESFMQEVDPNLDRQSVRIPLLVTHPIMANNLQVSIRPDHLQAVARVLAEDGHHFVDITFDPVSIEEEGAVLSILVKEPVQQLEDSYTLILSQRRELEISPSTLIFRQVGDMATASCIVRYRSDSVESDVDARDATSSADPQVFIEARLEDVSVATEVARLGRGIYRATLQMPASAIAEFSEVESVPKLRWRVVIEKKTFSVTSTVNTRFVSTMNSIPGKE